MGDEKPEKVQKHICAGLLAHVDAGKTTLTEALLYLSGGIRRLGRVDNRDTFLDTYELERERGITIFSKQAVLQLGTVQEDPASTAGGCRSAEAGEQMTVTLLDTPGHVDFSAEMERTLQVMDYAILLISGAEGVQGHTETLWQLLERYRVPTFLFINKMDQEGTDAGQILKELQTRLSGNCVSEDQLLEEVAMCDEKLLEQYLNTGTLERSVIAESIRSRQVFPCYFGSALKMTGIGELIRGLLLYTKSSEYPETFGARVYKIARDEQGNRLTYLKVTGGRLAVRDLISGQSQGGDGQSEGEVWQEKINQIRVYSGAGYEAVNEAKAGTICAVTGLTRTYPGEGLGNEEEAEVPVLEPVMSYRILLPADCDAHRMLQNLRLLEEEEPLLHIVWNEISGEIHAQLMGEVQIEVLKRIIKDRFGIAVEFDAGSIVYKETISSVVEGVGHFEPLRHYAEVHLLLEPAENGSGLEILSDCSEDELDRNWQRLILTHLSEKIHRGVLTGAPVTDMRITLVAGRAHAKHTEGGDFRQATYRAVRQGLMQAECVLLEPYYEYRLEVPTEQLGRAMSDLQRMSASFGTPVQDGGTAVLTGTVPVIRMRDYHTELISYTKGRGKLFCTRKGYFPCHNAEEVIAAADYDPERDLENPAGSIFCAHGAGFPVKWDEVQTYMHVDAILKQEEPEPEMRDVEYTSAAVRRASVLSALTPEEEAELDRMAEASRRKREQARKKFSYRKEFGTTQKRGEYQTDSLSGNSGNGRKDYLLVDGYNIIFAWETLRELAADNLDGARGRLMDILSDYQGTRKGTLILVFDAYKLEGFPGEVLKHHNIYVVYTKEAETADQYIEKVAHEIGRKYDVTVATSDGTEQIIIRGQGCRLLSAKELEEEVERTRQELREQYLENPGQGKRYLFDCLDTDTAADLERVRLGKDTEE